MRSWLARALPGCCLWGPGSSRSSERDSHDRAPETTGVIFNLASTGGPACGCRCGPCGIKYNTCCLWSPEASFMTARTSIPKFCARVLTPSCLLCLPQRKVWRRQGVGGRRHTWSEDRHKWQANIGSGARGEKMTTVSPTRKFVGHRRNSCHFLTSRGAGETESRT